MADSYRTATESPPRPRRQWWLAPVCWVLGHTWKTHRFNTSRNIWFAHMHPRAGIDATCQRCGLHEADAIGADECPGCGAQSWEPCRSNCPHLEPQ